MLERWAQEDFGTSFESLPPEQAAALEVRLQEELPTNTYDEATRVVTLAGDSVTRSLRLCDLC